MMLFSYFWKTPKASSLLIKVKTPYSGIWGPLIVLLNLNTLIFYYSFIIHFNTVLGIKNKNCFYYFTTKILAEVYTWY